MLRVTFFLKAFIVCECVHVGGGIGESVFLSLNLELAVLAIVGDQWSSGSPCLHPVALGLEAHIQLW